MPWPDITLDDAAVSIDQERLGNAHGLVRRVDLLVEVENDRKAQPTAFPEGRDICGLLVDGHCDEFEVLRRERLVEPLHGGHFTLARLTPSRPEIDEDDAAGERVEGERGSRGALSLPEERQFEAGRDRTTHDRRGAYIAAENQHDGH